MFRDSVKTITECDADRLAWIQQLKQTQSLYEIKVIKRHH